MDNAPIPSLFTSMPPNEKRPPKTSPLEDPGSSATRVSGAKHSPGTRATDPLAQQLASFGRASENLGEAAGVVTQYESFIGKEAAGLLARYKSSIRKEADRYTPEMDTQSIHHLSPEGEAKLQKCQGFVKELLERQDREGLHENGGGNGEVPVGSAFTSSPESNGKQKGKIWATTECTGNLRGEDSSTPKPMRANTNLPQSQRHDREITLLVSTLSYDTCTHFANRACYSGPPSKWTLFDEHGSGEVSLVTNLSSGIARKAFSYLTGKRLFTLKGRPLCVMYIAPRNGGEVLVRGLFMAKGTLGDDRQSTSLMLKLCGFFRDFEIAAISPPRQVDHPPKLIKETTELVSEYEVTISFARRWEAETVVEDMHGLEFEGSKLDITLFKRSTRPVPPQHMHLETVEALDQLLFDIGEGREHMSTVIA